MTLEGQEIHEKHQKSECCLKATAGVSRRALIQGTGAIDASVLPGGPDVHIALAQERHVTPFLACGPSHRAGDQRDHERPPDVELH